MVTSTERKQSIWYIFDRPRGYHFFTATRYELVAATGTDDDDSVIATATDDIFVGSDLDELRKEMERRGLVKMARNDAEDDQRIIEFWLERQA